MVDQGRDLDTAFAALADPTRRRILELLVAEEPRATGDLAAHFPLTRWAVMKHLAVLRDARLVQTFERGRRRLHFTDPGRLATVRRWLDTLG